MIAEYLIEAGEVVHRVNFCGNDVADWHHPGAIDFTEEPEQWSIFLMQIMARLEVTHIVLHGDRRFYHQTAIKLAQERGIGVVATELGYLRPDWMTAERGGCSALSHFPNDPAAIERIARRVGGFDNRVYYPTREWRRVVQELRFTFFNILMRRRFPHFRSHRIEARSAVYVGWIASRLLKQARRRHTAATMAAVEKMGKPYFIFAMQLNGDLQIRENSPFTGMREALEYVAQSFARHAPPDSLLIVKTHPLDHRQSTIRSDLSTTSKKFRLPERLVQIDHGDLGSLCKGAAGFVSVNSTAGFDALGVGCPTISLLPTIYDVEGLTYQEEIDGFWTDCQPPDAELLMMLRNALAGTIQVRGTIYCAHGLREASRSIAQRLCDECINEPDAFVAPPPRLAKAASMGVFYDHKLSEFGSSDLVLCP